MTKDLDELTALNRDYVASVQNSDVKRFDEILAPDFYCSNPDKSLVDRAAFLKQTAQPVAIKNLEARDVKIRVMGDFAKGIKAFKAGMKDDPPPRKEALRMMAKEPNLIRRPVILAGGHVVLGFDEKGMAKL